MEQAILSIFLALFALQFAIEFGLNELNLRQVAISAAQKAIPDAFRGKIEAPDYAKSIEYTLANGRFHRWTDIYGSVILLLVLLSGLLGAVDQWAGQLAGSSGLGRYGQGIIFCCAIGRSLRQPSRQPTLSTARPTPASRISRRAIRESPLQSPPARRAWSSHIAGSMARPSSLSRS